MFTAGPNDGFGGLYREDVDAAGGDQRHTLGAADALRCALFTGPAMALLGVFFLVRASSPPSCAGPPGSDLLVRCFVRNSSRPHPCRPSCPQSLAVTDPERSAVRTYNSAVASWVAPGGGMAQFQAALPAGLELQLQPPVGGGKLVGAPSGSVFLPLASSSAWSTGLLNASSRVAQYDDSQLAYVARVPTFYSAFPFTGMATTALAEVPNAPDFGASAPLLLVSCSNTQGLQFGVNCSAYSPPAPAPTAATELFVLERRRARRLMQTDTAGALESASPFGVPQAQGAALAAGAAPSGATRGGGRATSCRGFYRTVTVLSAITLVANAPGIPDTASGYANPNWTLTIAPCGAVRTSVNLPVSPQQWRADVKGLAPGVSPAWCPTWPQLFAPVWTANPGSAGLSVTLRSASDPLLAAQSLTKCTGVLGVTPGSYAKRGTLLFVSGSALTLAGLLGMHRVAKSEGHALGVAAPLASLKAAWQGYGATEVGRSPGVALGMPADFMATVPGASGSARRRAAPSAASGGVDRGAAAEVQLSATLQPS